MKPAVLFLVLVITATIAIGLSNSINVSFNRDGEETLQSRHEILGRPLRYGTWQLPNYIAEQWDTLNQSGALDHPNDASTFEEWDTISVFLDGWPDIENVEFLKNFPIDTKGISEDPPSSQVQLQVISIDPTDEANGPRKLTFMFFNNEALDKMPQECAAILVYTMMRYVADLNDAAKIGSGNQINQCLTNSNEQS